MSTVVRPSAGAFRHSLPLVLVFGAYRLSYSPALDTADRHTIRQVVGISRRLRAPMAFLREVCSDPSGRWLDGCQPKITDRVFDHTPGSAFRNKEFSRVFNKLLERDIFSVGPRDDSSLLATLCDTEHTNRRILAILPDHPLQNCSTGPAGGPRVLRSSNSPAVRSAIGASTWEREICDFKRHALPIRSFSNATNKNQA